MGRKRMSNRKIKVYKKCCVSGCTNRTSISDGVKFFKFPCNRKKTDILQKWCEKLCIDPDSINTFSMVCSDHFTKSCFAYGRTKVSLIRSAVPTENLPFVSKIENTINKPLEIQLMPPRKRGYKNITRNIKTKQNELNINGATEPPTATEPPNFLRQYRKHIEHEKYNNTKVFDEDNNLNVCMQTNTYPNIQSQSNTINISNVNNFNTEIIVISENGFQRQFYSNSNLKFQKENLSSADIMENYDGSNFDTINFHEQVIDLNNDSDSEYESECLDCIEDCICSKKQIDSYSEEYEMPAEYLDDALTEMRNDGLCIRLPSVEIEENNVNADEKPQVSDCNADKELAKIESRLKHLRKRRNEIKYSKASQRKTA